MGSLFKPSKSSEEKRREAELAEEQRRLQEEEASAQAAQQAFAGLTQTSPTGAGSPQTVSGTDIRRRTLGV